ncbi:uncharacterized protein LOC114516467 isoform X2 [Dendronephthya gigantea]|uniref:uncharacterized protein LOC114516467 isoform X2 n=1 Tax=Dendronephthya gigantea TaxID=151771 RepID=UPI00106C66A0|nr:uncharacterized protein LOC114516467 isoform X2 [Dendronephthya gigantea]
MAPVTDEERRWVVIGLCLTKVLTPALRKVLAIEMPNWYNNLCQPSTEIDKQVYSGYQKTLNPSILKLNYKNINNNDVSGLKPSAYDYAVKDPLSLAKLFVQPHMCKFTGFDQTMDSSAALSLICEAEPFINMGAAAHAKRVKSDIRNEWAHCKFLEWTQAKFNACFRSMESLLKKINLSFEDEQNICNALCSWKDMGFELCFGQPLDMEVFTFLKSQVDELCEQMIELSKGLKSPSNGARLSRLILIEGEDTLRKYFNSLHPPATLTATLNDHRETLETLHRMGVITHAQMHVLFPTDEMPETTSNNYDISLLFILLRNICGMTVPASTGSWDENPPADDTSPEADLVRIKYYRNLVYGHHRCTEVTGEDFNDYWNEISCALNRLNGLDKDLHDTFETLKTGPVDENRFICLLNEC